MGGALLDDWLIGGIDPRRLFIQEPSPVLRYQQVISNHGLVLNPDLESILDLRFVFLGVKPRIIGEVLLGLGSVIRPGTIFVSIAVGYSLDQLSEYLGKQVYDCTRYAKYFSSCGA